MTVRVIDGPKEARYHGDVVKVIGRRWPSRCERGMFYDIGYPNGTIVRDIPASRLDFATPCEFNMSRVRAIVGAKPTIELVK